MTTVHITKHCFYQELMLMSMIRETNLIKRKEKKNQNKTKLLLSSIPAH